MELLDEVGVKPCGHSAMEKGVLLRVSASCQAGRDSAELACITRGIDLFDDGGIDLFDDGDISYWLQKKLSTQQCTVNSTTIRCGKKVEEECCITSDAMWQTF